MIVEWEMVCNVFSKQWQAIGAIGTTTGETIIGHDYTDWQQWAIMAGAGGWDMAWQMDGHDGRERILNGT